MIRSRRVWIVLIILAAIFIAMSIVAESLYFSDFEYHFRTAMFNKKLAAKEKIMDDCLNNMKPILANAIHHGSSSEVDLFSLAEENKITVLEYIDNKLIYWSDNDFDVPRIFDDSLYSKPLIFMQNGWFLTEHIKAGNEKIVGLLRVYTEYAFENNIIRNGFDEDFGVPGKVGFTTDKDESEYHIYNKEGRYLFSLFFPEATEDTYFILIPLFLWGCSFVLLLIISLGMARILASTLNSRVSVVIILLFYSLLYFIVLYTGKPSVLMKTEFFSPYVFSVGPIIPSLGHFMLTGILAICFAYIFYLHFPLYSKGRNSLQRYLQLTFQLFFAALMIGGCNVVFEQLFLNSNINFETYKILNINWFSIAGFSSALLFLMVPVIFLFKIFSNARSNSQGLVILSILTSSIGLIAVNFRHRESLLPLIFFYFLLTGTVWIIVNRKSGMFNMITVVSLIFGVFFLYLITIFSERKTNENLKIQAVTFSTENDPKQSFS